MEKRYVVATTKTWNIKKFERTTKDLPGRWHLITNKDDLCLDKMRKINPDYIFFPHWSWIIPEAVYLNFECVVFHMTDIPFGRGGSPLQNLIERGIYETKISALKVVKELDAGPIYLKEDLSLHGSAEEIFLRASDKIFEMIEYIVTNQPIPQEQEGDAIVFKRRSPEQSRIPDMKNLTKVFDYIRMLDAEGYPPAFIETEHLRLEFSRASMKSEYILADAKITLRVPSGGDCACDRLGK